MSELKPMPTPGELILRFEWFTIRKWDGHQVWLEIDGGEGKAIPKSCLMGALAKLWGDGV